MRGRPDDLDNNIRGQPQPPSPTGGHGHGVHHLGGRNDAPLGLDVERRQHNEPQLPSQDNAAMLIEPSHNIRISTVSDCNFRLDSDPKPSAAAAAGSEAGRSVPARTAQCSGRDRSPAADIRAEPQQRRPVKVLGAPDVVGE